MIHMKATAIGLGISAGIAFGIITALALLLLIPELGFSYWEWAALPSLLVWALFMGFLPGALLGVLFGAGAGAFDNRLHSPVARVGYSIVVTLTVVAVTQLLLPIAWSLPRLKIALVIALFTFIWANLSLRYVLKSIRHRRAD